MNIDTLFARIRASCAVCVVATLGLPGMAQAQQTIKIGWLSSLTGAFSTAAIAENIGVQFAVDEINAKGGIKGRKLELITRDTASDATKSVNLAQQLVFRENVDYVIGPVNSGESLPAVPVIAKAGIPNFVIGTIDALIDVEKYPRAFRFINTNEQWMSAANDYAVNVLKRRKIAIIGDTTGYGTAAPKQATAMLEKMGIVPVYTVLINTDKTDITDEMNKAKAAGADVIMPWTAATGLQARIMNTRGEMKWDVPIVGHPTLSALTIKPLLNKPEYWENAYADGYASTTYRTDGTLPPTTQKLLDALKPKLGAGDIEFTFWWVALGYDCVKVYEYAVNKAGSTDPAAIQKALETSSEIPGVLATYSFSPTNRNGFPGSSIVMIKANTFKNGSYSPAPR
jgi:branched-chain amino acid transport system substrate-binding protein